MSASIQAPTLHEESRLWQAGVRHIAGVDEAGRGALAGPVVAAAVILPPDSKLVGIWAAVRDSKLLTAVQRAALEIPVRSAALAWGIGSASPREIDRLGIAPSTALAMARAVDGLAPRADYLLLDWVRLPAINLHQQSFVKGDRHIVSIAAASILAKVHRDRILVGMDQVYPGYGFGQHKGYGTASHLAALAHYGPCPAHRHSFKPIAQQPTLFAEMEGGLQTGDHEQ